MNSVSPHNTAPPLETGSEGSLVVDWSRVPAGLEIFASCRVLTVRQEEDEMEFIGNIEMNGLIRRNRYNIFDQKDHRLFHVLETTDGDEKLHLGPKRRYVITIFDCEGSEVLRIRRGNSACGDGIECFLGGGAGIQLGIIHGNWRPFCCKNYYKVFGDMTRPTVPGLLIEDAGWCSREFAVLAADDKSNAHAYITKRLTAKEGIHDCDVYVLEFKGSAELHPVYKALLLSSIFFLDFKYFEETREKKKDDKKTVATKKRKKKGSSSENNKS